MPNEAEESDCASTGGASDEHQRDQHVELTLGPAAGRPARRGLVGLAVVSAIALAVVGFIAGRASSNRTTTSTPGTPAIETTTSTLAPAFMTTATAPVAAEARSTSPVTAPSATIIQTPIAAAATTAGEISGTVVTGVAKSASSDGMYSGGPYADQPGTLVTTRTAGEIRIAAYMQTFPGEFDQPYGNQFPGWKPAPWCYPSGSLRISIVTTDAVNVVSNPWYTEPKDGLSVSSYSAGYVEGHPVFGVAAQVDSTVSSVSVTTSDKRSDSATPQNGLALLIVDGVIADSFSVTATHVDGSTTQMTSSSQQPGGVINATDYNDNCQPPPPGLPAAGDQPADPAAANAALRDAFAKVYSFGHDPQADNSAYIDDITGVADASKRLLDGPYGDSGKSSNGTIRELVFTSPTEAWFRYDLSTSTSSFTNRYGQAHLGADGLWKVTRQTICQDLALAPGAECSPAVTTLLPPSAQNDPRYNPSMANDPGIATTAPLG